MSSDPLYARTTDTESDWARTFYSLGHWFSNNPANALQCPQGDFVNTTDVESLKGDQPINGSETFTYNFLACAFSLDPQPFQMLWGHIRR
jgi:hypothetical protein